MEIRINDQNLDFTIEANETLGDVIKEIEAWLSGTDLVLYSVKHGERELLSLPYEQWAATPHTEVQTLNVMVKHTRELTVLNLNTILEYLDMLKSAVSSGDRDRLAELLPGFSALSESLQKHFPGSGTLLHALTAAFANTTVEQISDWDDQQQQHGFYY